MTIDVANNPVSAQDERGRLLEHFDITTRARFLAEIKRPGQAQDFGEIGNAAEIGAHQVRWSEQLDGEAVGLDLLGDMPGHQGGSSSASPRPYPLCVQEKLPEGSEGDARG